MRGVVTSHRTNEMGVKFGASWCTRSDSDLRTRGVGLKRIGSPSSVCTDRDWLFIIHRQAAQLSSAQQRITARRAAGSPSFSTAQRTSGLLISLPPRVSAYHFYRVQTATFALLPGNSSLIRKKKSSIVGGPVICPSTEPLREREVGNGEDESGVWEGEDAGGDGGGRGIPSTSWRWLLLFHGRLQSPVHLVHQTGLFLLLSIYFLKLIGIRLHLCGLCDDGRIGIVSSGPWLLRAPRCTCSHLFLPQMCNRSPLFRKCRLKCCRRSEIVPI